MMLSLRCKPILQVVKVGTVFLMAFLAYRSYSLYKRNSITVIITEVVKLPPQGCTGSDVGFVNFIHNNPAIEVKGSIEVETYLMRSYRFLLKLSAQITEVAITSSTPFCNGTLDESDFKCSVRGRVLSFATAYNHTYVDSITVAPSAKNMSNHSDLWGIVRSQPRSLTTRPSFRAARHSSTRTQAKPKGALIQVDFLNEMVDQHEVVANEHVCFTPACLSEEVLMTYTTLISNPCLLSRRHVVNPVGSEVNDGCNRQGISAPCLSSVLVQNAYVKPDKYGSYRISLDLTVFQPLHELRVLIRLPHRHCRLVRAHTGGIGRVLLAEGGTKPHVLIWQIGNSEAFAQCNLKPVSKAVREEDGEALTASPDHDLGDNLSPLSFVYLSTHFELIYWSPDENEYNYYRSNKEGDSDSEVNSEANEFPTSSASSSSKQDYNTEDLREGQIESRNDYFSGTRGPGRTSVGEGASQNISSGQMLRPSGSSSPPNQSSKARKRHVARLKKKQERERRRAVTMSGRLKGGKNFPTLEATYSVTGLTSGMNVRRLQILEDKVNWVPRSVLDRLLLRYVLPELQTVKLNKFAHYRTWFVQPIVLTGWSP